MVLKNLIEWMVNYWQYRGRRKWSLVISDERMTVNDEVLGEGWLPLFI